jgi:hypothetical protein
MAQESTCILRVFLDSPMAPAHMWSRQIIRGKKRPHVVTAAKEGDCTGVFLPSATLRIHE